ncbi:MAG: WecB/TagA/CpsF family glycosyltransferase [Planctomycetota bacterium]|nr:WecB/TagA/CpsF family glycosyltransferase [Planctomycetota bacterium]
MTHALPKIDLIGIPLHAITEAQCVHHVMRGLDDGSGGWIVTPNLDHLRRLVNDPKFHALCSQADLLVADGMPLLWASRAQKTPLPERVAGSNLISSLSAALANRNGRVFLLGGDAGTAEEAARVLARRHPDLIVCGIDNPRVGTDIDAETIARLGRRLRWSRPDIVFVALGSPKQEKLIRALRAEYDTAWMIGVGISFSFLAGRVKRAPRWMQSIGLEWAHRLTQEPQRLARRYLIDGIPFGIRLLVTSASRRF